MIRWPDAAKGPWGIRANWVEINGRPECVGLQIWHGADQAHQSPMDYLPIKGAQVRPITASGIAALPIATIIDKLRDAARDHWRRQSNALQEVFADRLAADRAAQAAGIPADPILAGITAPYTAFESTPGAVGAPRRYDRAHYIEVARTYLEAWQGGANPTQAVADRFGVSRSAAAKWVTKARSPELQLLTPADHGRSGAQPGPALALTAPTITPTRLRGGKR